MILSNLFDCRKEQIQSDLQVTASVWPFGEVMFFEDSNRVAELLPVITSTAFPEPKRLTKRNIS